MLPQPLRMPQHQRKKWKSTLRKLCRCPCIFMMQTSAALALRAEIWNGVGNPVYPPAKAELARHGISCEGKRAVQLRAEDYDQYDYLIGMDSANMRNMERMTGHKRGEKMHMLLEFTDTPRDVIDPWYSGKFDDTYRDIDRGCRAFLQYLKTTEKL